MTCVSRLLVAALGHLFITASGVNALTDITDSPNRVVCAPVYGPGVSRNQSSINVEINGLEASPEAPFGYMIYEYEDGQLIGEPLGDEHMYFCTKQLVGRGACTEEKTGRLLYDEKKVASPVVSGWVDGVGGTGHNSMAKAEYAVKKTGYYCVRVINPSMGTVQVVVDYRNAYGLLPPEYYPLLIMAAVFTLLYFGLVVGWGSLVLAHMRFIVQLQHYVTVVLGLFLLEAITTLVFFNDFNSTGVPSKFLLVLVAVFGAARATASLFILLLVSMGYGVVIPSLGDKASRIYTLTACHLVFSVLGIVAGVTIRRTGLVGVLLTTIPLSLTFTVFIVWILTALSVTKESLQMRKQTVKLHMYQRLSWGLNVIVGASFLFTFVAVGMIIGQGANQAWYAAHWRSLWFYTDGWQQIMHLLACAYFAYIFRPRAHNRRYYFACFPCCLFLDYLWHAAAGFPAA